MAIFLKTTNEHMKSVTTGAHDNPTQRVVTKVRPFIWRLLTMSLAMGAGMALFQLLVLLIRTSSSYSSMFAPGTDLYAIGMSVFMTVPTWLASQCGNSSRDAHTNGC